MAAPARRSGLAGAGAAIPQGDLPRARPSHPYERVDEPPVAAKQPAVASIAAVPDPTEAASPAPRPRVGRRSEVDSDAKESFSTRLPMGLQRRLRIHSAMTDEPIGEIVARAVEDLLRREKPAP